MLGRFDTRVGKPTRRRQLELCLGGLLTQPPVEESRLLPCAGLASPADGSGRRVLVAEDNQVNQKVVTHLLRSMGHRVRIAANGAEALRALAGEAVDIVLMDCQMPVLNGYETTQRIRAPGSRRAPACRSSRSPRARCTGTPSAAMRPAWTTI